MLETSLIRFWIQILLRCRTNMVIEFKIGISFTSFSVIAWRRRRRRRRRRGMIIRKSFCTLNKLQYDQTILVGLNDYNNVRKMLTKIMQVSYLAKQQKMKVKRTLKYVILSRVWWYCEIFSCAGLCRRHFVDKKSSVTKFRILKKGEGVGNNQCIISA